jgi:hypothetical protein
MISYAALAVCSRPVLSYCYTEHRQWYGVALSDRITTIAISKSGQLDRRCTVAPCPHVLRAMMTQGSDVSIMCRHALETNETSRIGRSAKHFFIFEICVPHRTTWHMAASEPSRARRRGPIPWDTWQRWCPLDQGGKIRSHETGDNVRVIPSSEAW